MAEHTAHKVSKKELKRKRAEEPEADLEDEPDERPRHAGKGKKTKKRSAGFPVGGLILMLFLIAAVLVAGYFGLQYRNAVTALKGQYEGALRSAEAERDAAEALLAEADPDSAAHAAERQQLTDGMLAEARAEAEALREQSEATDAAIREAEQTISELRNVEGYDYYRAIYDEYVEGRAYVEDLLSGN